LTTVFTVFVHAMCPVLGNLLHFPAPLPGRESGLRAPNAQIVDRHFLTV